MSVAIVGGGLAGLCAYATLRHGGLEPDEIAVFGDRADPTEAWAARAGAIRQRRMRSESDGHVAATSFPGLAVRTARRRLSVAPLALSVCNRYRPTVDEFLEHAAEVRERSGWDASFVQRRVEHVRAVEGGFELDGRERFAHVLLALGHPGLALPPELEDRSARRALRAARVRRRGRRGRRRHGGGDGMAERARGRSVRRLGAETRAAAAPAQPAAPALHAQRGLSSFHRTPWDERIGLLRSYSAPSYPPGRAWDEPLARGRFRVAAELNGAGQIICATGFRRGFEHDLLLRRLVGEHELETADRWIVLAPDSTVPALTDDERTLALAGVPAQWAFPAADTLVGAKYAARGFLRRVQRCRTR